MGNAASQGMLPSASRTKGSPQAWQSAIAGCAREIQNLNSIAAELRRDGCDEEDRELINIVYKLQGVKDKLTKRLQEQAQGAVAQ